MFDLCKTRVLIIFTFLVILLGQKYCVNSFEDNAHKLFEKRRRQLLLPDEVLIVIRQTDTMKLSVINT